MPQARTIQIQSIEDFVSFLIVAGDCNSLWNLVDIASLNVTIPIWVKGDGRDGRIDVWGATFLKDLQRDFKWAAKEIGDISLGGKKYALRQRVEWGSDKKTTDYSEALKAVVRKMTSGQITTCAILGILCATGYSIFSEFRQTDLEAMRIQVQAASRESQMAHDERLIAQLGKNNIQLLQEFNANTQSAVLAAETLGKDPESAIRKYVRSLRQKDTLKVGCGPEHSKKEALKKLRPQPEEVLFSVKGDGAFILQGVELVGSFQGIRIGQGAAKTTALLERLDEEIKKAILDTVDASMETQTPQEIDLQIDVYFSTKGIHHAVVIAVGKPRHGVSYPLEDIPAEVPKRHWIRQGEPSI